VTNLLRHYLLISAGCANAAAVLAGTRSLSARRPATRRARLRLPHCHL